MAEIRICALTKSFDGKDPVVKDITLTIADGEFVSLLGPSGCGKTTTLRCIAGLERPSSGEIYYGDTLLASGDSGAFVPPEKRRMGMIFQSYALWPNRNVRGNVAYPLKRASLPDDTARARVEAMLSMVGLSNLAESPPNKLSGGQQQRVALARALVNQPRVVLYDEPLSNLDALLRVQMRREIRRLHEQVGTTSVYVTHDRSEAMALSDRIVVLGGGAVQHVGTPREIFTRPANRFVADFMGFENVLKAEVKSRASDHFAVTIDTAGLELKVASSTEQSKGSPVAGSTVEIAARASAFRLARGDNGDVNLFEATVDSETYLGEETEYQLRAGGTKLIVRILDSEIRAMYGTQSPRSGDVIRLRVSPEELIEISP